MALPQSIKHLFKTLVSSELKTQLKVSWEGTPLGSLQYSRTWEDKGIIKSLTEEEGKNRRYDYKNIKKMLLIKELLDEGYTLDASAEKVKKRMEMISETFGKLRK